MQNRKLISALAIFGALVYFIIGWAFGAEAVLLFIALGVMLVMIFILEVEVKDFNDKNKNNNGNT